MTISQNTFSAALLDADRPVPEGLSDPKGAPAGARFSVYRNNVVVSLSEALATGFPLVRKLVGQQTFQKLAGHYVRKNPPSSPLMMLYGHGFPEFLAGFEPLSHIGYLADCAALDLALRRSYHAADEEVLSSDRLQIGAEEVANMRLSPAASTQVIRSDWPVFDIWRFNTEKDAPKPRPVAQDILITRPDFDPEPHVLPPGGADWIDALQNGHTFSAAHELTLTHHPEFDLGATLALALSTGAFAQPISSS